VVRAVNKSTFSTFSTFRKSGAKSLIRYESEKSEVNVLLFASHNFSYEVVKSEKSEVNVLLHFTIL
jgi:hypothetical protein